MILKICDHVKEDCYTLGDTGCYQATPHKCDYTCEEETCYHFHCVCTCVEQQEINKQSSSEEKH